MIDPPRRTGLTLVEMLVVVAILATMLGVLLPALNRARDLAARTKCQQNLLTIGVALDEFAKDHGGRFPEARPLARPVPFDREQDASLSVKLMGHLRASANVFHCPGDEAYLYQYCGMSYYYSPAVSGRKRSSRAGSLSQWAVLWDADNTELQVQDQRIEVPPFHDRRNALFADWHVEQASEGQTPLY